MVESSDSKMEKSVNWREEIAWIAGPFGYQDSRESWLQKAADKAGITFRMAKTLFYGQRDNPKHDVGERVRRAAAAAREEARALASQFEQIAGNNNEKNTHLSSEDIAALVSAARALRGLDCS